MAAATHAVDEPALPVLATATVSAPISAARSSATALARSLIEALGLPVSSFSHMFSSPADAPSRQARYSGVPPIFSGNFVPGFEHGNRDS